MKTVLEFYVLVSQQPATLFMLFSDDLLISISM